MTFPLSPTLPSHRPPISSVPLRYHQRQPFNLCKSEIIHGAIALVHTHTHTTHTYIYKDLMLINDVVQTNLLEARHVVSRVRITRLRLEGQLVLMPA